ncbi:Protein-ribulosamine 3-kinase, chloroplastic [Cytospora mali]|uniref:protein-ribulosamine 3-kinase n=1 Tax=Cytospora mali TaxID=578113 RepID=A0A194UX53_CYTMA|nr:Protein-ribulosamine 3-kinase, chloroplastic [Valsa mali var. pyri (nom. inval.)]
MMRGAFVGSNAIYKACPDIFPKPIGWGQYESDPKAYFVLFNFVDIVAGVPDMHAYPRRLAEMHIQGIAPDGKYGFHVEVMCAFLPIYVEKHESWEEFYTKYMQHLFIAEKRAQSEPSTEMERLTRSLFDRIIPRLIRPLETGGREIKPRLLHSNLWDGNAGVHPETEEPSIFDPSCFYGHNEFDLGPWRCPRHKTGKPYIEEYHKSFAKSAPEEDHEGQLDQRYPETYEEWATSRGETICPMKGTIA